jgi:hypothetical protein
MTKQTNEFQQLMHYIYSQMSSEGSNVTESAPLKERTTGAEREVDILIEVEVCGEKLRIAVECRDRARKDTIGWIDELIGKYQGLDVHKVVAVSRSGFSPEAAKKALANGIETRALEQALVTNWQEEFVRLGMAKLTYQTMLVKARVDAKPPFTNQGKASGTVTDGQGNVYGTLEEVVFDCFDNKIKADTRQYIGQHFLEMFETLADLKSKALLTEQTILAPNLYLTDNEGKGEQFTG